MLHNPFQAQAIAASANRRQQLDRLLRITAPHERIVLIAVALIFVGLGIWALFGNVVRDVTIDGVLIAPGQRHEVVALEPGHLIEVLVATGEQIDPGAVIARQSVPELEREIDALRERVASLEADVERGPAATSAAGANLASARAALLDQEARRTARELIVSQTGGEVVTWRASPGQFLPKGGAIALIRDPADLGIQAALPAELGVAQRLSPGMATSVRVRLPEGTTRLFEGTVGAVSTGVAPNWLTELLPDAIETGQWVLVDLQTEPGLFLADGTPCQARIVLGEYSPISLLSSP